MKTRLFTALHVLLLITIIYCADNSRYQYLFTFIKSIPGGDKLGHFFLMGIFALLLNLCLSCRHLKIAGRKILLGSLIVAALVTVEELSQRYIQYRSFDLVDLAMDYAGVLVFGRLAVLITVKHQDNRESVVNK